MTENDSLSDDDEYELEPIDPEILEHERQRGEQKTRQAESAIDIDEVYDESEPIDPITWDDLQRFRFTTRHLLIVTALLSVVLAFIEIGQWTGLFLVVVIALAAGWFFVLKKEQRERLQRKRHREEAKRRIAAERGEAVDAGQLPTKVDKPESEAAVEPAFRFSFSMKEMFGAMTVAAVLFALVRGLGGPNNAALLLGMIALAGLAVHMMGFDPPAVIVLGWWLLLVLYIVVGLWAAFGPGDVASIENGTGLIMGVVSRS
ncbi:MAG: hypothetical protein IH898_01865 [Planctomycetes bacterium]|nr:hypothetical protein [Planctomycetota bacterium]